MAGENPLNRSAVPLKYKGDDIVWALRENRKKDDNNEVIRNNPKYGASTNMACLELDKFCRDAAGNISPMFKVLFRVEIPRGDFTYTEAVNKIIGLNDTYDFDWIAVDRGYGETQIELLHKYGIENPMTGLQDKVVGYQFSEKVEVRDPYTLKKDKKPLKPFMVNNSVVVFEKGKIMLNPNDKKIIQQLEQYRVKSISSTGLPTYSDANEHIIDCINLSLLIFEQKYSDLLRKIISSKIVLIEGLHMSDNIRSRTEDKQKVFSMVNLGRNNGYIKKDTNDQKTFRNGMAGQGFGRSNNVGRRGF